MNLFTKAKQTHRHRKQTWLPKGKGRGRDKLVLLHIKQTIHKNLLYATGNSTQCSVMTYLGKESEKSGFMICMYDRLTTIQQKLTQHCRSTILQLKKITIRVSYRTMFVLSHFFTVLY